MKKASKNQTKFRFPALFIIYILVLIFLGLTVLVSVYADISLGVFSRDPMITLGGHPLTGVQSYLGVLIWIASASICFFCYSFLQYHQNSPKNSLFFLWSAVITFWLAFDDLFLIHEYLPEIVPGLSQEIIYAVYGITLAWYIIKFWKRILHSEYSLFVAALVFFGLSIFIDIIQNSWNSPWRILFEDGFKLFGIVSWSSYFIRSSFQTLQNILKDK